MDLLLDQYVTQNDIEKVRELLLEHKASINQRVQRFSGSTLLYTAALAATECSDKKRYMKTIRFLIESKANINTGQYTKRTPLHAAIANNNMHVVRYLLSEKADTCIEDIYDSNAMIYAISEGRDAILELLILHTLRNNKTAKTLQILSQPFKVHPWHHQTIQALENNNHYSEDDDKTGAARTTRISSSSSTAGGGGGSLFGGQQQNKFTLKEWCMITNRRRCLYIVCKFLDYCRGGKKFNKIMQVLLEILRNDNAFTLHVVYMIQAYIIGELRHR